MTLTHPELQTAYAAANRTALYCKQLCLRHAAGHQPSLDALRRLLELNIELRKAILAIASSYNTDGADQISKTPQNPRPRRMRAPWQPPHKSA